MSDDSIQVVPNQANDDYSASEYVDPVQNTPDQLTPILEISPERGLYMKILNRVARGTDIGVPIYARFRDQNGDPLPTRTRFVWAIEPLGANQELHVSDIQKNISYWNQNDLTTQQDEENIDSVKVPLKFPPGANADGDRPEAVNINGVDTGYLLMDSAAQIDWRYSEFYVEDSAVDVGRNE